ncbi:hypothetical protein EYF80_057607 [Liparis tanakae]|uniref:Uncharacterized protein n=1 Tax=Liparis tanakae TaxID=230148 RepID=A0A4Z2EVF8_9TELE|nr:hypothetical protein EYF80_057607 [Liparis tanakae]
MKPFPGSGRKNRFNRWKEPRRRTTWDPQEEEVHPRKGEEPRQTGPYLMGLATPTTVKRNHTGSTSHTAPRQEHLKEGQERRGEERRGEERRGEERRGDHHGKALPATEDPKKKTWSRVIGGNKGPDPTEDLQQLMHSSTSC